MKKTILSIVLISLSMTMYGNSCLESLLVLTKSKQKIHQILLLKGADCINCYRAGKIAQEQNILHPEIIVVRDIPKRYANDFLRESLNIDPDSVSVIFNDALWTCINPYITSAVAYISKGKIEKIVELKSILNSDDKSGQETKPILYDSLDLTMYYGGSQSSLTPKGNNIVIYNDFKSKIAEYSPSLKKAVYVFKPEDKNYLTIDSLGGLFPDVERWRIAYTNSLIDGKEMFLKKQAGIGSPYVTANFIYIPMSITIVDTISITQPRKREDVMYPYSFFAKYDTNWNLKQLLGFPFRTIQNYDTFFNSLSDGYFKNDSTFYMMVSSTKTDSLFAAFTTTSAYNYTPKSFLNTRYPEKFPQYNKLSGHLMRFTSLFTEDANHKIHYLFCLDNELYSIENKEKIKLEGIPNNKVAQDSIISFIHAVKSDGSYLYVIYSSPHTLTHLNKYDIHDFHLISSRVLYEGKIQKALFWGESVCVLKETDDSVILYRYLFR